MCTLEGASQSPRPLQGKRNKSVVHLRLNKFLPRRKRPQRKLSSHNEYRSFFLSVLTAANYLIPKRGSDRGIGNNGSFLAFDVERKQGIRTRVLLPTLTRCK